MMIKGGYAMSHKILTVSSANMDLNMRVERSPEKGETLIGGSYSYVPGGKGANSATAVARLGSDSYFCTAINRLINVYIRI